MTDMNKLERAPLEEAYIGSTHNQRGIEDIINEKRWPKVQCKVCGEMHIAGIMKISESMEGSKFQFIEPQCPNRPAETPKE